MRHFNWQLAALNAGSVFILAIMGAGILVPIAALCAVFVCDYRRN